MGPQRVRHHLASEHIGNVNATTCSAAAIKMNKIAIYTNRANYVWLKKVLKDIYRNL